MSRYVVYGAGAVGGTIGARLWEHGHQVVLLARGGHLEVLRRQGLRYGDPERTRQVPVPVAGHPSEVDWQDDDCVILAVKAQDTADALLALRDLDRPELPLVCAQNGLDNERQALRHFRLVYGMCVMMPAVHVEPGSVDAPSWPIVGRLDLGRYPVGVDDLSRRVAADLSASGFLSEAVADIMRWKRAKLLVNLATAVRAACGPESGDGPVEAAARASVAADLRGEAELCFARAGATLPTDEERAARWDGAIRQRPIEGRPYVAGSSWQSLTRRTGQVETDYLNGEIVLLGRLLGVPTPANLVVQQVTGDAARRRLGAGRHSVVALRAEIDGLGLDRPATGSGLPPR